MQHHIHTQTSFQNEHYSSYHLCVLLKKMKNINLIKHLILHNQEHLQCAKFATIKNFVIVINSLL